VGSLFKWFPTQRKGEGELGKCWKKGVKRRKWGAENVVWLWLKVFAVSVKWFS